MTAPALGQPIPAGTFGGLFIARSVGTSLDEDKEFITSEGFTIVSEDLRANETRIFVFGTSAVVGTNLSRLSNDEPFNRFELPSFFFLLPEGEVLTESLIRQWANRGQVAFQ